MVRSLKYARGGVQEFDQGVSRSSGGWDGMVQHPGEGQLCQKCLYRGVGCVYERIRICINQWSQNKRGSGVICSMELGIKGSGHYLMQLHLKSSVPG